MQQCRPSLEKEILHSIFFSDSSIQNYLYILDGDFEPERDESDDEETIAKEEAEAGIDEVNN